MSNPEGWKIARERIAAEKEAKTGFLDLGRLGLTEPPESLFELEHLERLNLGKYFFDSGGNFQSSQSAIETNTIGAAFAKLKNLPLLRHLFLSDTYLKSLTPLRKLTQLQTLDCSFTQVSELTPLRELTQLQTLNCSSTQVSELTPLRELTQLQTLDCAGTQVSELTPLRKLTQLQTLRCSFTNVSELTPLRELTQLQTLDCSHTKVSDLTPLRALTQLQTLDCYDTQIRTIPEWLVRLPKLTEVVISGEKIQGIPPEVLSPDYGDNCLDPLRAHFDDLAQGSEPLTDVKMIVIGNGRVGKTQICRRLHDGGYVEDDDPTHGIQVRSIDFPAENPDDRQQIQARLHLWDFGGQELYHGTHRLFLKARSVFMVVWDKDLEPVDGKSLTYTINGIKFCNHKLPYWLESVRLAAGYRLEPNKRPPVIVVQNKCDERSQECPMPPVAPDLLNAFQGQIDHLHYSALKNRKDQIDDLKNKIGRSITDLWTRHGIPKIGTGRANVRHEMERRKKEESQRTMTVTEFEEICQADGKVSSPRYLLEYLDDIGVVIYRPEFFGDQIILDHDWAFAAVYAVLDWVNSYTVLKAMLGRFNRKILESLVWSGFSKSDQELFLGLMVSCGICFVHRLGDPEKGAETEYIAPDLLPQREQVNTEVLNVWKTDASEIMGFDVILPFLHPGLMRGLISRVGALGSETPNGSVAPTYWVDGFGFFDTQTLARCLVEQKRDDRPGLYGGRIEVRTRGGNATRLLHVMRVWLEEILSKEIGECVDAGWSIADAPGCTPPLPRGLPGVSDSAGVGSQNAGPPAIPGFDAAGKRTYGISYAWKTTESLDYACRLWKTAQELERECLYDRHNLKRNDSFREFVEKLSGDPQRRLLVILSKDYLESDYCMQELHAVWESSRNEADFMARIRFFPMGDTDIRGLAQRSVYVTYWEKEFEETDVQFKKREQAGISREEQEEFQTIKKISLNIGAILAQIKDRIYTRDFAEFERDAFEDEEG